MITHLNTVSLYVADQERARRFYVDQLGFEVRTDTDMGPMGRWLEVAPKGAQTSFVLASAAGFDENDRVGKSADVTLRTSDVRALHNELAAKGVPVTEPVTEPWSTWIKVTDPDGHEFVVGEE
jgi:catechol 2,3-dioxygenase-like lactoylglutathione lyase family enzyme